MQRRDEGQGSRKRIIEDDEASSGEVEISLSLTLVLFSWHYPRYQSWQSNEIWEGVSEKKRIR